MKINKIVMTVAIVCIGFGSAFGKSRKLDKTLYTSPTIICSPNTVKSKQPCMLIITQVTTSPYSEWEKKTVSLNMKVFNKKAYAAKIIDTGTLVEKNGKLSVRIQIYTIVPTYPGTITLSANDFYNTNGEEIPNIQINVTD